MSQKELKETSEKIVETLELIQTDIVSYEEENIPLEQEILNLKETAEFINSKVKIIKVSDEPVGQEKDADIVDIENEKIESLTDVINLQHKDNAVHKNLMNSYTLESIKHGSSEDPSFEIYKQKVIEQLELLKNNYEHIIQLYERQEETLRETFKIYMLITDRQNKFSDKLQEKSTQYHKECEESVSVTYKQELESVKRRIQNINFMRVIISRLLIYGNYICKDKPEFEELLIFTKSAVSIDSLLKE